MNEEKDIFLKYSRVYIFCCKDSSVWLAVFAVEFEKRDLTGTPVIESTPKPRRHCFKCPIKTGFSASHRSLTTSYWLDWMVRKSINATYRREEKMYILFISECGQYTGEETVLLKYRTPFSVWFHIHGLVELSPCMQKTFILCSVVLCQIDLGLS